jgi:4-carboxymuconolactone decarboxylase
VGRQQGLRDEEIRALSDPELGEALGTLEKLVVRYAEAMTRTPVEVPDALFAELRRHFDERQLVELTSSIAWENYRARFDHAFGIESAGFSEGRACPLPEPRPRPASESP